MTRSVNIERTDQLVWSMITKVHTQICDQQPLKSDGIDPNLHESNDRDGLLIDGFTWMTPDQLEMLSNEERKVVIGNMTSKITVHFDGERK